PAAAAAAPGGGTRNSTQLLTLRLAFRGRRSRQRVRVRARLGRARRGARRGADLVVEVGLAQQHLVARRGLVDLCGRELELCLAELDNRAAADAVAGIGQLVGIRRVARQLLIGAQPLARVVEVEPGDAHVAADVVLDRAQRLGRDPGPQLGLVLARLVQAAGKQRYAHLDAAGAV